MKPLKRRKFGLLAGSGLGAAAAASLARPALAQSTRSDGGGLTMPPYNPDPALLQTTLTPSGAERAGNADGSIPPWTGGYVLPPLGPNQPQGVKTFDNEKPLYTVNRGNMAQYSDLLSDGVKALMSKFGFWIQVFQTHRTAAWPDYFVKNTALNVKRAVPEPSGLRFGFTGAYGGIPFPLINTSDPLVGGAQLIWNHLINWDDGWEELTKFTGGWVVTNGHRVLTFGGTERYLLPYFDPHGSPETYDGYFSKLHEVAKAPASSFGQENLVWSSSNVQVKPDITWTVVAGQGRVRKAPDEAYDTPNPSADGIGNYDDSSCFDGSPQMYDWKVLGKKEMLVPYNCNKIAFTDASVVIQPGFPNPKIVRWEKHRVWVVEATLHPGNRNTTHRRMCYLDEDTYLIMLAEMYDANNKMVKVAMNQNRCLPHLPGTVDNGYALWELEARAYTMIGFIKDPPWDTGEYIGPENPELFSPEEMAATASF